MHVVQHLSIPPLVTRSPPTSSHRMAISHLPAISHLLSYISSPCYIPRPRALHLHSLAVDRDKVVENDEGHGSYTKTICEVCKCVIRDHFVLIVDSLTISRISGATVQRRNGAGLVCRELDKRER